MQDTDRRRFLKGASVVALAGLAGCTGGGGGGGGGGSGNGNDSSGGSSDNGSSGDGSNNGGTTGSSSESGSKATIRFWHAMTGKNKELIEDMAADFSKQSDGYTVEATKKGSYRETLNATINASQSGNPPAVTQIFDIGTQLAIDSGLFVPIKEFIPADRINYDNFLPSVTGYYKSDGKLKSMPFNSSNAVMFINREAFEKAGLDPDNPPKTYADLTDAAKKLKGKGGTPKGVTWANHSWFVEQWFAEQNQPLVNKKNGREGRPTEGYLSSDAGKTTFEWWQDLSKKGLYLNPGIENWDGAKQAFSSQKAGLMVGSTASIVNIVSGAKQNDFTASTAKLPVPKGQRNGVVIGGASLWVTKGMSKAKQQAAQDYLLWLNQPKQQIRWHKNTGYFPVRKEAVKKLKKQGWFDKNPNYKVAFDQLQASKDTTATRGGQMGPFQEVRTIIEKGFVSLAQGNDVNKTLQSRNEKVNQALKDYNQKVS